jgi:putative flippase GtrA
MSLFQTPTASPPLSPSDAGPPALLRRIERSLPFPPLVWRICRFLTVGLVGLAVDGGLFWSLFQAGVSLEIARALSLALATLVTWWLNRIFTFASSGRPPVLELLRYVTVALVAQGFNYGLFLLLVRLDEGAHPLLCLLISAVATAALSFTGQSLIAFRRIKGG